jgi:hypothetical protein
MQYVFVVFLKKITELEEAGRRGAQDDFVRTMGEMRGGEWCCARMGWDLTGPAYAAARTTAWHAQPSPFVASVFVALRRDKTVGRLIVGRVSSLSVIVAVIVHRDGEWGWGAWELLASGARTKSPGYGRVLGRWAVTTPATTSVAAMKRASPGRSSKMNQARMPAGMNWPSVVMATSWLRITRME